ncbi:hypothetical protein SUGI_0218090 [Cryptomeria japonica]|uniref:uncharacterized protein LOC131027351 n=1 Tax=Cryptomeria japonica TaxID=3369 RepID=UPI00240893EC|nr:uncharacterized protein LOC131027351 [Cryptomeria japonica]GLJ13681.1 hypothetical protein SUGI_0218090 [Cryptomeria japonica]
MESSVSTGTVVDGSEIRQLVENKETFQRFVDEKFCELDKDKSGNLNVEELQPIVSNIGKALGLPSRGSSPDSDHIYEEVTKEFLHGKERISKEEFSSVLADFLLGMADGLERDPIFIQTITGQELQSYVNSPEFEAFAVAVYSQLSTDQAEKNIETFLVQALGSIPVDKGMPPISDETVMKNIVKPAIESQATCIDLQAPCGDMNQVVFIEIFKKVVEHATFQLKATPITVARSEKTYDGKGVTRLLHQKSELEKVLQMTWNSLSKDQHGVLPRGYLRVGLDILAPSVDLPPLGAVKQMDEIISEVFKMVRADEGGVLNENEFNKLMLEILATMMLQLEGNSIRVSSVEVVNSSPTPNDFPL